jgi:hypothetical protein
MIPAKVGVRRPAPRPVDPTAGGGEASASSARPAPIPLSIAERSRIRSQIGMSLCNIGVMHLFWGPTARRIYARSIRRSIEDCYFCSRGRPKLPRDAVHVGDYEFGISAADVLEDLDYVIATSPPEAPEPDEPEPIRAKIATPKVIPKTNWKWAPTPFFQYGRR